MVRLPSALAEAGIEARMLLQVHDELIFEAEESIAEAAVEAIRAVMESAADPVLDLAVPLVAEAGIADSWADAH
ncbi:MAG: DNA polymerase, partial [Pseudomonadota bacterium]|nr:DNA polymerase [Pseudomonadota bacterium]